MNGEFSLGPYFSVASRMDGDFSLDPYFSAGLAKEDNFSVDLKLVNEAVDRRDFEAIIKNKDLFWARFCKTFAEKKSKSGKFFDVKVVGEQAQIKSRDNVFPDVKRQVEFFRLLALEAFETHCEANRVILDMLDYNLFFRKPSTKPIDLIDWSSEGAKDKFSMFDFKDYVKPYLRDFFDSLAFDYSESKTTQLMQFLEIIPPKREETIAIRVALRSDQHFVYPITPAMVPSVSHLDSSFYACYKSGRFCDYDIVSSEGKQLKVHGMILEVYGGPYFQALLSSNMKETAEHSIKMDYPYKLIQSVVDSFYLGPKYLEEKLFKGEKVDVYGILQFAHAHDLQPLFKQMINLLMLVAGLADAKTIRDLANCYRDDDLHRLADHLSPANLQFKA